MRAPFTEQRWGIPFMLACTGCVRRSGIKAADEASGLDALWAEARSLSSLLAPTHLLFVATVVIGALGLNALAQALLRLGWRLGFDSQRRWARRSALTRGILAAAALAALLRSSYLVAPALTALSSLAIVLSVLLLSGLVPNLVAGVGIVLRGHIRVGDRVKIGQQEGVVRDVGLVRLRLSGLDGATVLVPNRLLMDAPLIVDRARHRVPVRARVSLDEPATSGALERLRQVAALSPYRAPDSLIDVSRSIEDERRIVIEIQVWASRAQRDAKTQLEAALERAAARTPRTPP